MSTAPVAARTSRRSIHLVIAIAVVLVLVGGLILVLGGLGPKPEAHTVPLTSSAGLVVAPGGVLLPTVGATKQLAATRANDGGVATVTWTSSKPDVVSVDASGLLTAKAFGSAQVVATAGDLTSAPVLVTVVAPTPGTVLVEDEQVIGDPVETNPDAPVTPDSTYDVVLRGVTVAVGDLLLGTGELPVGGRVVATTASGSDTKVTLRRVALPELLPHLELSEEIDLSQAPVEIPAEIAANYDVVRDGSVLRFTPKPEFDARVRAAASDPFSLAGHLPAGGLATTGGPLLGVATGTYTVPPFVCEQEDEEDEGPAVQPFKITEAPTFEISINPVLDTHWSSTEKHAMVVAAPTVTAKIAVKSTLAFSATWECKVELARPRIRAGWFSLLITGLVPLGVGFEIGGEIQLAEFGISTTTTARSNVRFGVDCPVGASCSITGTGTGSVDEPVIETDVQELEDFRVKPSLEIFGYLEFVVGNPFLVDWHVEAAEAKAGLKLEADWAPQLVQILDDEYASKYGLSFEAEAKAGPDLGSVAESLGLDEILSVGFEESIDIVESPTGRLTLDKAAYANGERGTASIVLDEDGLRIGPAYVVRKVLLLSYVDGERAIVASADASDGQTEFEIPFTAPRSLTVDNLYAFVVPRLLSYEPLALELGEADRSSRIFFFRIDQAAARISLNAVDPETGIEVELPVAIGDSTLSPTTLSGTADGSRMVLQTTTGMYITDADGLNARSLVPTGVLAGQPVGAPVISPDGSQVLVMVTSGGTRESPITISAITSEGAFVRQVIAGQGYVNNPTWSPDGTRILFNIARNHGDPGISSASDYGWEIWIANSDGSGSRVLMPSTGLESRFGARFSPDGTKILFLRQAPVTYETNIWVMNADGSDPTQITTGTYDGVASWSPDGSQIAFIRAGNAEGSELWVMNADGSEQRKIPIAPGVVAPAWMGGSPDED